MIDKMTVLNVRMTRYEKEELKERAEFYDETLSSYVRKLLFSASNTEGIQGNASVIQEKDNRIADLKSQLDDYKKQIDQLHTIILATQKDNQLLLEQKSRRWWQFWK